MRYLFLVLFAPFLFSCGGGGGGSSSNTPSTTTTPSSPPVNLADVPCAEQEISNGYTLCLAQVTVDGAKPSLDPYVAESLDLNGDGYPDVVYQTNANIKTNVNVPLYFLSGAQSPTTYSSLNLSITGGAAESWYIRQIITGDFNGDGKPDFYPVDASEYGGTNGWPWEGTNQYVYLNNSGSFAKTNLLETNALVHGAGGANFKTDGFWVAANTPWGSDSKPKFYIASGSSTAGAPLPGLLSREAFFYTTTIDVNKDGKKDVIGFSSSSDQAHHIYINNGSGVFTAGPVIPNYFPNQAVTVEGVAVADFNGDGWDDFVILQIDRRGSNPNNNSWLRVYINNKAGSFTDQTSTWLGTAYQNNAYGWVHLKTADMNNDGKADLFFVRDLNPGKDYSRKYEILMNTGSIFSPTNFSKLQGYIGNASFSLRNQSGNYFWLTKQGNPYVGVIK
jgi:FG-GAP-like repeat